MVIERIQGFVDHTVFRARGARFKELPHFGRESGGVGRVEQLADWLVSRVVGELGVSVAFLLVRDAERHAFAVMAYRGLTEPSLVVLGEDNPVLEWLGRRDHAVMLRDLRPLPQWRGLLERERQALERTRAELLVPLRSTRGLMAVLAVGGRLGGAPFSPEATRLLEDAAYEVAISVENARLSEQVGHQLEELRAVHQQMVRSAKLAVVGELAASVAHEVTNPLQAVMNLTYLLRRGLNQEDPQRADLQALEEAVQRAGRIVSAVLDVAHPGGEGWRAERVNVVLRSVLPLADLRANGRRSGLSLELAEELSPVWADGEQLRQVFLNLVTNAVDAMDEGGTLRVSTAQQDGYVVIRFQDTGKGIPPHHLPRIFEPFFTDKPLGQGTGLGLAVSRSIVERHEGTIGVVSRVREGTTVSVRLPALARRELSRG